MMPRTIVIAVLTLFAAGITPCRGADDKPDAAAVKGFAQLEAAETVGDPAHLSKLKTKSEASAQGQFTSDVKWKIGGRLAYDAVYDGTNFYPPDVRRDQRYEALPLETFLDISKGDWEFRVGRQQIVWGEAIALFVGDVVSALDLREFVARDFDQIRIPQWAARAEYFKDDFHAEAVLIPFMTYNNIGKPGADFYPLMLPPRQGVFPITRLDGDELRPRRTLSNAAGGGRLSYNKEGYDTSVFYYHSVDAMPVLAAFPTLEFIDPGVVYRPAHFKIDQYGFTLSKDLESFLLKAEAVYTSGRRFNVARITDNGLVRQDTLDYLVSVEWSFPEDTRLNLQFFQRYFPDYDQDLLAPKNQAALAVYVSSKFLGPRWETQLTLVSSLNRNDWMARPRIIYTVNKNWRLALGADCFGGVDGGFFGRFRNKDRLYSELRYSF